MKGPSHDPTKTGVGELVLLSSLWLGPAALWWHFGVHAADRDARGMVVNSFPFEAAQRQAGVVTLVCLGVTVAAWTIRLSLARRRRNASSTDHATPAPE